MEGASSVRTSPHRVGFAGALVTLASVLLAGPAATSAQAVEPIRLFARVLIPSPGGDQAAGFARALSRGPQDTVAVGAPIAVPQGGTDPVGRVFVFSDLFNFDPTVDFVALDGPAANGLFGAALADLDASGALLIGAPGEDAGRGALYRAPQGGPPLTRTGAPSSLAAGAAFGSALAPAGPGFAVVGAPGAAGGAAFDIGLDDPPPPPLPLPPPLASDGALFGAAVEVSDDGDRAFVGAPFASGPLGDVGAVYVFDLSTGVLLCTLADPTPQPQDGFGASLAAGPGFVVVGAPFADAGSQSQLVEGAGAVYVFDDPVLCPPSGIALPIATIGNPDPTADTAFGTAVAVFGQAPEDLRILVGAPFDDSDARDGGAVYQFYGDRATPDFGLPLRQQPRLVPIIEGFDQFGARFGSSIAPIGSDFLAVAAPGADGATNAAVVVFHTDDCGHVFALGLERAGDAATTDFVENCACGPTEGMSCSDGIPCTTPDRCVGLKCIGTPGDCPKDPNPCFVARCDPNAGGCVSELDPTVCDDGDPCTIDSCNPATGQCNPPIRANGCTCKNDAACDDHDICDGGEVCARCKGCDLYRTGRACCDKPRTCVTEFAGPPAGTSCNDGNACTQGDVCTGGKCSGTPCDDRNPCTVEHCDAVLGCVSQALDCDDHDSCTADSCVAGSCQHTRVDVAPCTSACVDGAADCYDGDPCTQDTCNAGSCQHTRLDGLSCPPACVDGAADCNDGDPCTRDTCNAGICGHQPLQGFDAVRCTFDAACAGQDVMPVVTKLQKTGDLIERAGQTEKKSRRRTLACKAIATTRRARKLAQRLSRKDHVATPCRDGLVDALMRQAVTARSLFTGGCP
jgi:hypothetical protein